MGLFDDVLPPKRPSGGLFDDVLGRGPSPASAPSPIELSQQAAADPETLRTAPAGDIAKIAQYRATHGPGLDDVIAGVPAMVGEMAGLGKQAVADGPVHAGPDNPFAAAKGAATVAEGALTGTAQLAGMLTPPVRQNFDALRTLLSHSENDDSLLNRARQAQIVAKSEHPLAWGLHYLPTLARISSPQMWTEANRQELITRDEDAKVMEAYHPSGGGRLWTDLAAGAVLSPLAHARVMLSDNPSQKDLDAVAKQTPTDSLVSPNKPAAELIGQIADPTLLADPAISALKITGRAAHLAERGRAALVRAKALGEEAAKVEAEMLAAKAVAGVTPPRLNAENLRAAQAEAMQEFGDTFAKGAKIEAERTSLGQSASSAVGGVMETAGKGVERVASGATHTIEKLEPVIKAAGMVFGGLHGLGAAEVVTKGVEHALHWSSRVSRAGTALRALAQADWHSSIGVLEQLGKSTDAPAWLREIATTRSARAAAVAAKAAGKVAEGTAHGLAVGTGLSTLDPGATPEERGQIVGGGGVFGAAGAIAFRPVASAFEAKQARAHDSLISAHEAIKGGADPVAVAAAPDSTMYAAANVRHLFKGTGPGGKDLTVRLVDGDQYAKAAPHEPGGVAFYNPADYSVTINLSRHDSDGRLIHEALGHALVESPVANRPEIHEAINTAASRIRQDGTLLQEAERQYAEALRPRALYGSDEEHTRAINDYITASRAEGQTRLGNPNAWILSEIAAEASVRAAGGGSLRKITGPDFRGIDTRAERGPAGSSFFSGDVLKLVDSPELATTLGEQRGRVQAFRPGLDEPQKQGVRVNFVQDLGKKAFAQVQTYADGSRGNDYVTMTPDGRVIARPNNLVRRVIKNRRAYVNASVPTDGAPLPAGSNNQHVAWRETIAGLAERSGRKLGSWFYSGQAFSETAKEIARKLEAAIANGGEALSAWYHQIGDGDDWKASVASDLGNVEAQYKDFVPVDFLVTKNGNLIVRNYSLTALERKAQRWAQTHGALSLDEWNGDVGAFKSDLKTYLANHAAGNPGADGIGEHKRNVINAFLVGRHETFLDRNPLRAEIRGGDRQGIVRSYRLDRLEPVEPSQLDGFAQPRYEQQVRNFSPASLWVDPPQQEISSAATSINAVQLPMVFSRIQWQRGTRNADIGGGRFDNTTQALKRRGVENVIYDPYNRSAAHNKAAAAKIAGGQAATATVSNVLNVIKEPSSREKVIRQAYDALAPGGSAYFAIYEGDKSGTSSATPKGWQENRATATYVPEIERVFGANVARYGRLIEAKKPQTFFSPAPPVDTPEFKAWFGRSVARNHTSSRQKFEDAPPLRLYHGTRSGTHELRPSQPGGHNTGPFGSYPMKRAGVFLSDSPEMSGGFAEGEGGHIKPLYAKVENPLDLRAGLSEDDEAALSAAGMNVRIFLGSAEPWEFLDHENGGEHFVETLKSAGFDGVVFNERTPLTGDADRGGRATGPEHTSWVVFDPSQVKSATGNSGAFDPKNPDIRFSPRPAEKGFYSKLETVLEKETADRMPAAQVLAILRNRGVKAEEMKWTKAESLIRDLAEKNGGRVPKDALLARVRDNAPVIKESTLAEDPTTEYVVKDLVESEDRSYETREEAEFAAQSRRQYYSDSLSDFGMGVGETDAGEWTIQQHGYNSSDIRNAVGDTIWKEQTYPTQEAAQEALDQLVTDFGEGAVRIDQEGHKNEVPYHDYVTKRGSTVPYEVTLTSNPSSEPFESNHFESGGNMDEPSFGEDASRSYLGHRRVTYRIDADGKHGLFLEELQSDRHQKGREQGYVEKRAPLTELPERFTIKEVYRLNEGNEGIIQKARMMEEWRRVKAAIQHVMEREDLGEAGDALLSRSHSLYRDLSNPDPRRLPYREEFQDYLKAAREFVPDAFSEDPYEKAELRHVAFDKESGTEVGDGTYKYPGAAEASLLLRLNNNQSSEGSQGIPDAPFRKDWPVQLFKRALRDAVSKGLDWIGWTDGRTQADRYKLRDKVESIHYSGSNLTAYDHQGKKLVSQTGVLPENLSTYIGKELAERLMAQPVEPNTTLRTLKGEGLEMGGEGMIKFYDKMLPSEIGSYVKKWGAKVAPMDLPVSRGQTVKAWRVEISPQMASAIRKDGQERFSPAPPPGSPELDSWFGGSKVVDGAGKPKVVYHGTKRPDRVGNRFRADRATSGPMPFFTDDTEIGSKYALGKTDTSLDAPLTYSGWFKVAVPGYKHPMDIDRAWAALPPEERRTLAENLYRVSSQDPDGNDLPDGQYRLADPGEGGLVSKDTWDYEVRRAKGNHLEAAVEMWLASGTLFNDEESFLGVLKAAGMDTRKVAFDSPHAEYPAVYPVLLSIKTPLNTSTIPDAVIQRLNEVGRRKRIKPVPGNDQWDKRSVTSGEWLERLNSDRKDGTSHAWTSIPDWVTDTLRSMGYDGIQDVGGKNGGPAHAVWVPFDESQVKSATGNVGSFNPAKRDIRFSPAQNKPAPLQFSVETVDNGKWEKPFREHAAAAKWKPKIVEDTVGLVKAVADIYRARPDIYPLRGKLNTTTGEPLKALVSNADFKFTLDVNRLCKRVTQFWETTQAVETRLKRPLGEVELLRLGQAMREDGDIPGCIFCYVEASRRAAKRNAVAFTALEQGDLSEGQLEALQDQIPQRDRLLKQLGWSLPDLAAYVVDPKDRATATGPKAELLKMFDKYVRSSKGTALTQNGTYTDEILKLSDAEIRDTNERAGLRWLSATDLDPTQLVDTLAAMADSSVRGLAGHEYSKDPYSALIFGDTGMKINTSIAVDGREGQMTDDVVNGMPLDVALRLREKYPNVGTMLVAKNLDQIEWGLEADGVDMMIPHHAANWAGGAGRYGIFDLDDFSKVQHERWVDPSKAPKDAKGKALSPKKVFGNKLLLNYWIRERRGNEVAAVRSYLAFCRANGVIPKFDAGKFKSGKTAKTETFPGYTRHPNFIRLLKDYARTDSPQRPLDVTKVNRARLTEYLKRFTDEGGWKNDRYQPNPKTVERMVGILSRPTPVDLRGAEGSLKQNPPTIRGVDTPRSLGISNWKATQMEATGGPSPRL
jgi:hypothetical protein